jgi:hypothetical protein
MLTGEILYLMYIFIICHTVFEKLHNFQVEHMHDVNICVSVIYLLFSFSLSSVLFLLCELLYFILYFLGYIFRFLYFVVVIFIAVFVFLPPLFLLNIDSILFLPVMYQYAVVRSQCCCVVCSCNAGNGVKHFAE